MSFFPTPSRKKIIAMANGLHKQERTIKDQRNNSRKDELC